MTDVDLHPELAARGSFAHVKLGKRPRKNDPRTLRLAKYLAPEVTYPEFVDWTTGVEAWPMYGNDQLGDCTIASAGHMIQAWTQAAAAPATPSEGDVVAGYWATGSDDSGRFELDVLNFWRTQGIAGHEILAYVALDPKNLDHLRYAIATFGGVYTGVALPLAAQGQAQWRVVGDGQSGASAPGTWGGHAIPYLAYDLREESDQGGNLCCITWGGKLLLSEAFHLAYCDEVYAIVTRDFVEASGVSATGLDVDALLADLHVVEQAETPANITVGEPDAGDFRLRIPEFPWELALKNATYWIQEMPDGRVILKFAPAQAVPGRGQFPMPPAVEVAFAPEGWAHFEKQVAAKGEIEAVPTAAAMPPDASKIILPT